MRQVSHSVPRRAPRAVRVPVRRLIEQGAERLHRAGVFFGHGSDNAWDESAALVLHALGLAHSDPSAYARRVGLRAQQRVRALLSRRIAERIPAVYLTGETWFAGLPLYVDARVLVPRSPIAELIERRFAPWLDARRISRVLDVGTGSGCIAIACAKALPWARVDALDISPQALEVAARNVRRHRLGRRLRLIRSDHFASLGGERYDLIVSNPPYVGAREFASLPPEYRHEPPLALAAGRAGLDSVRVLLGQSRRHLRRGGALIVEVGNTERAVQRAFPELPFTWLQFERGGGGVFLLGAEQLAHPAARAHSTLGRPRRAPHGIDPCRGPARCDQGRLMSGNTFGRLFTVTTFGESHGPALGCIVDGCPPGLALSEADVQADVDRRRTGTSHFVSQRRESDQVRILSGVFEGRTTGTPIGLIVENTDARSRDYEKIKDRFRPGHADYTYQQKYGLRDYRGGGRSSARETVMRVAAGAIARKYLATRLGVRIYGYLSRIGALALEPRDVEFAYRNPFFCPDPERIEALEALIWELRAAGDSIGARVTVVAAGVPPGLGEPVFGRLDADIAAALMGINAVKAVEIGAGTDSARQRGSEHRDELTPEGFASNHAGGILGGISSGQDVVAHLTLKPTSSIQVPGRTIDIEGRPAEIVTTGRHDPCVGLRATPIAEAMLAIVLMDHYLRHRGQNADVRSKTPDIARRGGAN